ncbi:MAG: hypothetical protein QM763_04220 [Agriterribacter sp.]
MSKRSIIYLLINIPLTYLLFISFGWLSYAVIGGNPTFFIPFKLLILFPFAITITIALVVVKRLKIYEAPVILLSLTEIVCMYLAFYLIFF